MRSLQQAVSDINGVNKKKFLVLRSIIATECYITLKALKLIDYEYTTRRRPKGYNLVKRHNKKLGHVYYVRYWYDRKMLPSKWCTHTNSYEKACNFAEKNREKIITEYLNKNGNDVARFFEKFYDANNPIYKSECIRNGELREVTRGRYTAILRDDFVPFLRRKHIRSFEDITVPVLDDFQDELLCKGIKSKSVNCEMASLGRIFRYLTRKGLMKSNPYLNLGQIPVKPDEEEGRGCYELDKMKGIFNRLWEDKLSYLLNLVIHTTDMRNGEIRNFCRNDIISISGCYFIDIKDSKTKNGIRLVPLHYLVYREIAHFSKDVDNNTLIFSKVTDHFFRKAYMELGKMLNVSDKFLKEQRITFYSGRHFWKTLMNAAGLGEDAEEVFMGHRVSNDVAKLYNHRDKQGKELLVKKARQIFEILDKRLFGFATQIGSAAIAEGHPDEPPVTLFGTTLNPIVQGVAGTYTQIPAGKTPRNEFEFNGNPNYIFTRINNKYYTDAIEINLTRDSVDENIQLRNITIPYSGMKRRITINFNCRLDGPLEIQDVNAEVYLNGITPDIGPATVTIINAAFVAFRGTANYGIVQGNGSSILSLGDGITVSDLEISEGCSCRISGNVNITGTITVHGMLIVDNTAILPSKISYNTASAGQIIDNRPGNLLDTFQRRLPTPPENGIVILQSVNGALQWVTS